MPLLPCPVLPCLSLLLLTILLFPLSFAAFFALPPFSFHQGWVVEGNTKHNEKHSEPETKQPEPDQNQTRPDHGIPFYKSMMHKNI
jgi:hypothetical protein